MTDKTSLGDRMKRYEHTFRQVLPRRTYTLMRLDGRAFHAYLKDAEKPFDEGFMEDMDFVTRVLCAEIQGAQFAYTQSDEISILITDFQSNQSEPAFGGVTAKLLSIPPSLASVALDRRRARAKAPQFDCRVWCMSDPVEVANYFIWRQRDAVRNSISMAAQSRFSPKQLHGISSDGMQELLWSKAGINWSDYPDGYKRGRVAVRLTGERSVEYTDKRSGETVSTTAVRSWWEASAAPHFTTEPGDWLTEQIPALPTLSGE